MKYIIIVLTAAVVLAGCNSQGETDNGADTANEAEESPSVSLRNIEVVVENDQIQVTAEANAAENEIYYTLEQGETLLVEEEIINLDGGHYGWSDFQLEVELPEEVEKTEDAPIIKMYGKDDNGELINPNYIPVDLGN
ncbi:lipoprotein [Virgibacillus ainsalahensis]